MKHLIVISLIFLSYFANAEQANSVSPSVMKKIYEEIKTPYKYGIVLKAPDKLVDGPSVFSYGNKWYMIYVVFDNKGYETKIAESSNLLDWTILGNILSYRDSGWDCNQIAGYAALQNHQWGQSYELKKYKNKYWMSYLGGALTGYETEPLSIGIAWSNNPSIASEWNRLDHPVLSIKQDDVRQWEKSTLFKSHIIYDEQKTLGHPFVMYYNAATTAGYEQIGMAVSDDMETWTRYGNDPVVTHGSGITGDPQIAKIGDVWVMFYFGAFWCDGAIDRFACSYDLVNWTKWDGQALIAPSESWDAKYAHKPWVIKVDGVVYHYYCAVGDQGRVIALATSDESIRQTKKDDLK